MATFAFCEESNYSLPLASVRHSAVSGRASLATEEEPSGYSLVSSRDRPGNRYSADLDEYRRLARLDLERLQSPERTLSIMDADAVETRYQTRFSEDTAFADHTLDISPSEITNLRRRLQPDLPRVAQRVQRWLDENLERDRR